MLAVDEINNNHVSFYVIGHHFLLGNGQSAPISQMKEVVGQQLADIYDIYDIDWAPVEKYLADNKESYGDFEDWAKLAAELELTTDSWVKSYFPSIMIGQGQALEELSKSSDIDIRASVARAGCCLDVLVNDKSPYVRTAVARQAYNLETLVNDEHASVRQAVAMQGYGLDKLCNDTRVSVRLEVAKQGYCPDIMIKDPSSNVRAMVAKQGYHLETLADDPSSIVRTAVKNYTRPQPV